MPYPSTWAVGDVVGRNYVPRPKFTDGTAAGPAAPWTAGTTDQRDLGTANGGTQYRLGGFASTAITLEGVAYEAGRTFTVSVLAYSADATSAIQLLGSKGTTKLTSSAATKTPIPQSSGYVWHEFSLTVPATEHKNSVNVVTVPTTVDLVFTTGTSGNLGIARVRVDDSGSPVSGYFDGDTPDVASVDFGWAGTVMRSASTATALTSTTAPGGGSTPAPPVAGFTASTNGLTVTVDGSGSTGASEYAWTFGDGGSASGVTASHTYASGGTRTITLTVTGPSGTDDVSASVTVTAPPTGGGSTDPDPEPTPEPITGLSADVVAFMGRTGDGALEALAAEHVPVIAEMVTAYVRGHGPTRTGLGLGEFSFPPDLRAVVITASARLLVNPAQLDSESADGYAARGSFTSFSLAEQAVLHRYRRRAA